MKTLDIVTTRIQIDVAKSLGWKKQGKWWVAPDHRINWAAQWDYDGFPSYMEEWTTDFMDADNLLLKMPEGDIIQKDDGDWVASYFQGDHYHYFVHPDRCIASCLAWLDYNDGLENKT